MGLWGLSVNTATEKCEFSFELLLPVVSFTKTIIIITMNLFTAIDGYEQNFKHNHSVFYPWHRCWIRSTVHSCYLTLKLEVDPVAATQGHAISVHQPSWQKETLRGEARVQTGHVMRKNKWFDRMAKQMIISNLIFVVAFLIGVIASVKLKAKIFGNVYKSWNVSCKTTRVISVRIELVDISVLEWRSKIIIALSAEMMKTRWLSHVKVDIKVEEIQNDAPP